MSRNSLHRPRRNRAVWDCSATGTRLLPNPSPTTVSPGYPLPGDGRSIDSSRHTLLYGHSRVSALSERRSAPATATGAREGLWPDNVGFPEAIAPRVYSTVARPGEHISPGDGSEDALPLLRMAERKWDLFPLPDSPVVSLGDSLSTQRRGRVRASIPPNGRARSVHGHAQPNGPARPVHGHAPQRHALWPCTDLQRLLGRARADVQPSEP